MAGRIPEFDSQQADRGLQVNEQGTEAWAHAGRTINALYREGGDALGKSITQVGGQVGDYLQKQNDVDDLMKNSSASSKAMASTMQGWHDTMNNADIGDQTVGEKGMADFQKAKQDFFNSPSMQGVSDKVKQHFVEQWDAQEQHHQNTIMSDMSTRAGLSAQVNTQKAVNNYTSMVETDFTPNGVKLALDQWHQTTDFLRKNTPNLTGDAGSKMVTETQMQGDQHIVRAAVNAAVRANPEETVKRIESGEFRDYYHGEEETQLLGYAKGMIKAKTTEQRQGELDQQKSENESFKTDLHNIFMKTSDPKTGDLDFSKGFFSDMIKVGDVTKNPAAGRLGEEWKAQWDLGKRMQEVQEGKAEKGVTDKTVYDGFAKALEIAPGQPGALNVKDVYVAASKGQLNDHDLNFLTKAARENNTENGASKRYEEREFNTFMKGFEKQITGAAYGTVSPKGDSNYTQARLDVRAAWDDAERRGVSILDRTKQGGPEDISGAAKKWFANPQNAIKEQAESWRNGKANATAAAPKTMADFMGKHAAPTPPTQPGAQ